VVVKHLPCLPSWLIGVPRVIWTFLLSLAVPGRLLAFPSYRHFLFVGVDTLFPLLVAGEIRAITTQENELILLPVAGYRHSVHADEGRTSPGRPSRAAYPSDKPMNEVAPRDRPAERWKTPQRQPLPLLFVLFLSRTPVNTFER